jgi:hypothetical protein
MAPSPITEDYYMILEVEQTAPLQVIIGAYRRLALKLHPDRNRKPNATETFQLVCYPFGAKPMILPITIKLVLKSNIKS